MKIEIFLNSFAFEQVSKFFYPVVHSFFRCPVLPVIDIEAEGAGDGEGQVGDDGEHVHPGGPVDILEQFPLYHFMLNKLNFPLVD